jgi:hypothetical protein
MRESDKINEIGHFAHGRKLEISYCWSERLWQFHNGRRWFIIDIGPVRIGYRKMEKINGTTEKD